VQLLTVNDTDDPGALLTKIKGELESSPFYYEFIHRMEGSEALEYNIVVCSDYLAERRLQLSEPKLRLFNYLKQYLHAHVRWSYKIVVRLSGRTHEKCVLA